MDQIDFVYKENKKDIDPVESPQHLKSENHSMKPKEVSQLDMTKIEEENYNEQVGDDEHKIFRKLTHE